MSIIHSVTFSPPTASLAVGCLCGCDEWTSKSIRLFLSSKTSFMNGNYEQQASDQYLIPHNFRVQYLGLLSTEDNVCSQLVAGRLCYAWLCHPTLLLRQTRGVVLKSWELSNFLLKWHTCLAGTALSTTILVPILEVFIMSRFSFKNIAECMWPVLVQSTEVTAMQDTEFSTLLKMICRTPAWIPIHSMSISNMPGNFKFKPQLL